MTVQCNHFVFRQTPESRYSHFVPASGNTADTWTELEQLAERLMQDPTRVTEVEPGKVRSISVPLDQVTGRFFSGVILVEAGDALTAKCAKRRGALPGEQPFIQHAVVGGKKEPAKAVDIILYHESHLSAAEKSYTPEGATEPVTETAQWQVISVNCRTTEAPEPPTPQAMMRNYFAKLGRPEGEGGSAMDYSALEFAESIAYWSLRSMLE
jgi:hypothetical protein